MDFTKRFDVREAAADIIAEANEACVFHKTTKTRSVLFVSDISKLDFCIKAENMKPNCFDANVLYCGLSRKDMKFLKNLFKGCDSWIEGFVVESGRGYIRVTYRK